MRKGLAVRTSGEIPRPMRDSAHERRDASWRDGLVLAADQTVETLRARKKTRQRLELLRVAEALFREKGYEATRMEDIALRSDVAKKTVYNYFPTKQSLLIGLLDEDRRRMAAAYQAILDNPPRSAAEAFALLIRADIGDVRTEEDKKLWRELLAASIRAHTQVDDEFEANRELFTRFIVRLLKHYQNTGQIPTRLDVKVAVDVIYAINAYDFRCYCASPRTPDEILKLARKQMRLVTGSWRCDESDGRTTVKSRKKGGVA